MRVAPPPQPYPPSGHISTSQTRLIGRSEELRAVVSSIETNGGSVIVGPEGIGKTALANAAARAVRLGFHVVQIRGSRFSAGTGYGALGWLLSELPDTPLDDPVQVLRALKAYLQERAGGRRTLLVVDNIHELDPLSQTATIQLMRQSAAALVATTPDLLRCGDELVRLWSEGMIRRIDLGPLEPADSLALMEDLTGGRLSALAAHSVWLQTRGNPLFTSLLCRDQMTAGRLKERSGIWTLAGPLTFKGEIADWMASWYRRIDEAERRIVDLVSLCPGIQLQVLLAMGDERSVENLEEQGILVVAQREGTVWMRDPLYARLIAELVPMGHFFELWQELLATGPDLDTWADSPARAFAEWGAAAGGPVDPDLAARACAVANQAGTPETAIKIAAAVEDPRPHPRLKLERARALRACYEASAAEDELRSLTGLQDPETLVPALLELAQVARLVPHPYLSPQDALRQAETAAQGQPEPLHTHSLQLITAARAALAVLDADPSAAPEELSALCLDWTAPTSLVLGAQASRCQLLALEGRTGEAQKEAAALWERLRQVPSLPLTTGSEILSGVLCTHVMCAEPGQALAMLSQANGVRYLEHHLSVWSELPAGVIHALTGRADAALECLLPALRQLEVDDPRDLLPLARAAMAYCYAERQDWDKMGEYLGSVPEFRAAPAGHVLVGTRYFQLAAALARGTTTRSDDPAAQLAREGQRAAAAGSFPAAVLYLAAAGLDGDLASAQLLETTAAAGDGAMAGTWQKLGAGLRKQSAQLLFEAAEALLARGFYGMGYKAALAAQETADAADQRELSRRARVVANECYRMLADANSLRSRMGTLSDFERDLAVRAASGASSARLGSALHLSPRTVDWHLGRIFQKLHVSGRAELRRLLGEEDGIAGTGRDSAPGITESARVYK